MDDKEIVNNVLTKKALNSAWKAFLQTLEVYKFYGSKIDVKKASQHYTKEMLSNDIRRAFEGLIENELDHLFESLESFLIYVYEGFLMEVEGMDSEESGVPEDFQFVSNHDEEMIRDVSDPLDAHFARVGNCLLWKFLKSYVAEQEKLQNEANERDVQDLEYKIQRARSNS